MMKKVLKKYNDFILESEVQYNDKLINLLDLRIKFTDDIINGSGGTSFSSLCKRSGDPIDDYNEFSNGMGELGWDINKLKDLFSKKSDTICGFNFFDLVDGKIPDGSRDYYRSKEKMISSLNDKDGYVDLYLYFLSKELKLEGGQIHLGGEGWALSSGYEDDEYIIRAAYGYHQTEYGKLMLKSIGLTTDEFLEKARSKFEDWFKEEWIHGIIYRLKNNSSTRNYDFKLKNYTIVEDDRMIISLKTVKDDLSRIGINVEVNDILQSIYKSIDPFKMDTQFLSKLNEFVIWFEFKDFD